MNSPSKHLVSVLLATAAALTACTNPSEPAAPSSIQPARYGAKGGGGKPTVDSGVNNLSYPVIWAEGVTKTLPGTAGVDPVLQGEWWYQWGTNGVDPDVTPASCKPDPDASNTELNPDGLLLCDNGISNTVDLALVAGTPAADNPLPLARAYLQKDVNNVWQAASFTAAGPVTVDLVDWGDNLESVDWYINSQVRTEVVLFEDSGLSTETYPWPMLEYEMRHTDGWGINEVHGLATSLDVVPSEGAGTRATVYSDCARLTIQKLLTDRGDAALDTLVWEPGLGWTEPDGYEAGDLVNEAIFNGSVHEGGDGPGFYSAEINVKGRIIYGYTWNVRQLNQGEGDYRLTFSFDEVCGTSTLNTYFVEGVTNILVPVEETLVAAAADEGGATAVLPPGLNLTYIDVRILPRGGGGGGGGKGRTK